MPAVISDTTALNYLARIGQFEILRLQFQRVLVPPAVLMELSKRPDLPGERSVQAAIAEGWMELRSPQSRQRVKSLRITLGAGEAEAIALAQEIPSSLLLIDEVAGRAIATQLHLKLIGIAGILLQARKDGVISNLKPLLDELRQRHNFRLSQKIYEDTLREAGELK
jgi:predicted nucleic acid-binding protein